ncbi:MAG: hypothetical protein ACOY95_01040 [Pseudomonadota bacterium]
MRFVKWLNTREAKSFANELAAFVLAELSHPKADKDTKFMEKAQKTLAKAAIRLQKFKAENGLNYYQRSVLANQFLWALRDGGCPQSYADQLTEWLTLRL